MQQDGQFEKASKLLYETIPQLQKELKKTEQNFTKLNVNHAFSNSVTVNEVAEVISTMTGIPLKKLLQSEKTKLNNLEVEIKKCVKGQDEAVKLVTSAVLRGRAGINDPNKPIGSFLFLGPTGVGKTYLAKVLTTNLFDSEKAMIRFDMSEFMEKHSVAKLIGAPPGYVGYDQGGLLSEAVRRKPYAVLLFDEIEKAHPDVLNILLQILDDGQLKDSQGHFVNFKNTIIIMTSNLGSEQVLSNENLDKVMLIIKNKLKPEFVNRIDEIIVFKPLEKVTIKEVVKNQLNTLTNRLINEDYQIVFDNKLVDFVVKNGYDPVFGARPIKRFIQKNIENIIASDILADKLIKNKKYLVTIDKTSRKVAIVPFGS